MRLPRSLASRLVVTTVALVAVAALLISGATALVMRSYLNGQLDDKVLSSARRAEDGPGLRGPGPHGHEPRGPFGNQEPATLVALPDEGVGIVLADQPGDSAQLDDEALDLLADVPDDGEVHTVDVPEHGRYRVTVEGGLVSGLPTESVDAAVASVVRWELLLTLLGVVSTGALASSVVRRQLRPLTEVAETARAVATLPLASGEVGVTERVPAHLTDERTEVGQVGAALNTLLSHVESSLDARHRSEQQVRQFVADASHELRTPLATIVGYAELARRRPGDAEAAATALAKVEEESTRMTRLVEDLLLLARLDAGRPLAREPVDLTRLLLEAVEDARVLAPEHRWALHLPEESVEVLGDEQALHQVVTNLLTNARKHTPPGTEVTVSLTDRGFEVADDGPGFPPELAEHAFERFARGDAARHRQGGVGLGLALVRAIVTAHGGDVRLDTTPGDTRIRVDLR
ncbi:cell wall metabolism sensor histidine kinase WalK [Nocardioides sp. cx-173]|uniref:sensor histidine kinase n=1 Tax=Nocardioides sp. cx-173 TaxID=2898796 RepID=UPI001E3D353A|nr:HAMP domain-containing sensor histidine kinase [Nocardioides sp. cx-173]MCD4526731.1 HAMP domain-containing histidine kinase [Nocardioides sp. cx-173]UGB42527.1 HAMP domain-containing histidine kinase [Nocardioides sp. cx-173]